MGRSKVRSAALCAALLVAAACSSSGDDDGTSAVGADDTEATTAADEPAATGEPVPVTMQLESATAATATVGPAGGSVYATAGDGTEYALQIPPGALGTDTAITVTPLAGLDGMPEDTQLSFGVSLEPEGLLFASPGWLFVTSDVDPADVFSGIRIDDGEATLAGIAHDGERFVLPVAHFSGGGGAACFPRCGGPGGGWPGFPGNGPPPAPGTPGGGTLDQPTGGGFPPYQPPGTPPGPFPGDDGTTSGGSNPTGHGSLTDGLGDPPAGGGSLQDELGRTLDDLGEAQLTGDEEGERRAQEKLDKLKGKIKDEAWKAAEACVDGKDLTKLKDIVYWVTVGQLVGAAEDDEEEQQLVALIEACNAFELQAIGDMEFQLGGDVFIIGDSIDVTIPLPSDGAGYQGEAVGDVEPTGYDRGAEMLELLAFGMGAAMGIDVPNDIRQNDHISCSVSPKGQGRITALATDMFSDEGPRLNLAIAPAREASVNCPDPIGSFPMPPWVMDLGFHVDAGFPGASETGLLFEGGWTKQTQGNPFATRDVHHEIDAEGMHLVIGWHLTINHKPGPLPPR